MVLIPALIYTGLVGGAIVLKMNNKNKFDPAIHDFPELIEVKEAVKLIKKKKFKYILDVRTKKEYLNGHLEDSILIESLAKNPKLINDVLALIKDKESNILIYCRSGRRSMEAAKLLKAQYYQNVYTVINGGYTELSKSI